MYLWLVSIKYFRRSCGLRNVWYDTNECLAATLDGQLFVSSVTRRVLLMEQELLTHPTHPRWPPVFSGVCVARSLVFNALFFLLAIVFLVSSKFSYVLSLMTRSFIPSFCYIIINAPPLFFPVQPFTSIFYYLSVCSRRDYNYITAHVPLSINQCI